MGEVGQSLHPVYQALLATGFTWVMTLLGAAGVFLGREVDRRVMDAALGFAAGVMIAASYWSLLAPAVGMAEGSGLPAWLPAAIGFLAGGAFLRGIDALLPHLHLDLPLEHAEGIKTSWERSTLLVIAITLHNIPEGLAIGVSYGSMAGDVSSASIGSATALAIGIGIQNLPEGLAVSLPLRREGLSRMKSFFYGQLPGLAEPVAGLAGVSAVLLCRDLLPYALGFAAGAMIYVVVEELIPESQRSGHPDLATMGLMMGVTVMMILAVAFT